MFKFEEPARELPPTRYEAVPIEQLAWLLKEYDRLINFENDLWGRIAGG